MNPKDWKVPEDLEFAFTKQEVIKLTEEVIKIISLQPMVLKVRAPLKIFGDIHGQ
jgi:hypothetical protein